MVLDGSVSQAVMIGCRTRYSRMWTSSIAETCAIMNRPGLLRPATLNGGDYLVLSMGKIRALNSGEVLGSWIRVVSQGLHCWDCCFEEYL